MRGRVGRIRRGEGGEGSSKEMLEMLNLCPETVKHVICTAGNCSTKRDFKTTSAIPLPSVSRPSGASRGKSVESSPSGEALP
jgi:hypothetical protein